MIGEKWQTKKVKKNNNYDDVAVNDVLVDHTESHG